MKRRFSFVGFAVMLLPQVAMAQVNSGSNGSDGALNPTQTITIDMHDHPTGIYQYTSVNIPNTAGVYFTPNDANTPVVWLVQGDCMIAGPIILNGQIATGLNGGAGGPGGFRGGNGPVPEGQSWSDAGAGFGPGGGSIVHGGPNRWGGNASYATAIQVDPNCQASSGSVYGSPYLLPLIGGSGGSGGGSLDCTVNSGHVQAFSGGSGGGGAILIACSGLLTVNATIQAAGGSWPTYSNCGGGAGSGGAVRLVASGLAGNGYLYVGGGGTAQCSYWGPNSQGGEGRIRLESPNNSFTGGFNGSTSIGLPNIILLPANQTPQLSIASVAGMSVDANPQASPNVRINGLQSNPINIVVQCQNVAMNSQITVDVKPINGAVVSATGTNSAGTQASSTATIALNMPRGEGTIQARTTTTVLLGSADDRGRRKKAKRSPYETGLAANGERFAKAEITSTLGGGQQVVYVTESGKRFTLGAEAKKPTIAKPPTKKG